MQTDTKPKDVEPKSEERFELVYGLKKDGKIYKTGVIKLLTNKDKIEIGNDPDIKKYSDLKIEVNLNIGQVGDAASKSFNGDMNLTKISQFNGVTAAMATVTLPYVVTFDDLGKPTKEDIGNMFDCDTGALMNIISKLEDEGNKAAKAISGPLSSATG
jgi:hypothetical protein